MKNPTPEQIKQARKEAGLTQSCAAYLVYVDLRTWQRWEEGSRKMNPSFFEIFNIKIRSNDHATK